MSYIKAVYRTWEALKKNSIFKPCIRIKQMARASAAREKAGDESGPVSLNKESVTLLSPGLWVKPCTEPCFFFTLASAKNIPGNLIDIDVLMLQAFSLVFNRPSAFLNAQL